MLPVEKKDKNTYKCRARVVAGGSGSSRGSGSSMNHLICYVSYALQSFLFKFIKMTEGSNHFIAKERVPHSPRRQTVDNSSQTHQTPQITVHMKITDRPVMFQAKLTKIILTVFAILLLLLITKTQDVNDRIQFQSTEMNMVDLLECSLAERPTAVEIQHVLCALNEQNLYG